MSTSRALTFFFTLMTILAPAVGAVVADHAVVAQFGQIPADTIELIKNNFRIFYGHTSHGSQIVTGMDVIRSENGLYDFNNGAGTLSLIEYGDDLGGWGDVSWDPITRQHLNEPGNTTNIVVWSWCGGCSDNTEEGINTYLNTYAALEADYPDVIFIYMTGHLDGSGPAGNLYVRNNQIRAFCAANGKALFDFADIESYDPDGAYYPDESDYCAWCYDWCAAHTCPDCGGCAHSHCFNCYQKGKAFWWLLARLTGWNSDPRPCADANDDAAANVGDAVYLINYVFKGGPAPNPECYGDANGDGQANVADAVFLINYVFKGGPPPPTDCCP